MNAGVIAIVARLAPGAPRRSITRRTTFAGDLGWDEWYLLSLAAPVRRRFHVTLADFALKKLRTVGDLADLAWGAMTPDGMAPGRPPAARLALVAGALLLLRPTPGAAAPEPTGGEIRIGHSYSSARALRQPATFTFVAENGQPTLTVLDAGFLYGGPLGGNGGFEAGGRVSAGSARAKPDRVFGAIGRGWWRARPISEQLLLSLAGEYLADGGFVAEEGAVILEGTLLGGPPGLGRPIHQEKFPLSWRPWLGASVGRSETSEPASGADPGDFLRAHARLEVAYARGGSEFGLEATGWLMEDYGGGAGYVKSALSMPLTGALSLVASGEAGRQPPRFVAGRRLGLGIGFRL